MEKATVSIDICRILIDLLTSEPFAHDLLACSGITSGDTTSCLLHSVKQDVEFRLFRIESETLGVGDEIHSSEVKEYKFRN